MERFGPTRRGGPVFRWLGEPLAIDLANTVMVVRESEEVDLLTSPDELASWLERQRPRLGDCSFALPALPAVRRAREDVRDLLGAAASGTGPSPASLRRVNSASAAAPIAPRLEIGGDGVPRLAAELEEVTDLPGLLGAFAHSAIRLVADQDEVPLNICTAPSCGMFFVGRRRWCCSACGNRARAARHYRLRTAGHAHSG